MYFTKNKLLKRDVSICKPILTFMKALLFINGKPPTDFPDTNKFDAIFCTDGAYKYLSESQIRLDFVIGDFDSVSENEIPKNIKIIKIADQDFTDFYKSLEFIVELDFERVDVFGATGMESDHFLGNLSVASLFKSKIEIIFHDDFSEFYFTPKQIKLRGVQDKIISLYPFPLATKVNSKGLAFPLNNLDLHISKRIGTRNHAVKNHVEISYEKGELLIFISKYTLTKEELEYKTTL